MKRYIVCSNYSKQSYIYHGTLNRKTQMSIVSQGLKIGTSGDACITDSLFQAKGYGHGAYVVRCKSSNLDSLNLVRVDESLESKRYTEESYNLPGSEHKHIDGVYEPLHFEPNKFIFYIWNVAPLQGANIWELVPQYELDNVQEPEYAYPDNYENDEGLETNSDTLENNSSKRNSSTYKSLSQFVSEAVKDSAE